MAKRSRPARRRTGSTREQREAKRLRELKRTIRVWAATRDMTLNQFARRMGIKPAHLSNILSGRAEPSFGLAILIERRTGIPPRSFAKLEGAEP